MYLICLPYLKGSAIPSAYSLLPLVWPDASSLSPILQCLYLRVIHVIPFGSCSRTIQRFGKKSPDMVPQISITIGFQKKNSSDLDMGQCPKLKSDEFFFWNPLLVSEIALLCKKTLKRLLHCLGALPTPATSDRASEMRVCIQHSDSRYIITVSLQVLFNA